MAVLGVTNTFSSGTAIVASQMNTNFDDIEAFVNTTPGVLQLTGGTITGAVQLNNTLTLGSSGAGHDVKLWGDTSLDYFEWDADTNKLTIEGAHGTTAIDVSDGNVVIGDGTLTVGSDGYGEDVTFYSDTAGDHFVWDSSAEKLTITGTDGNTALDIADGNVEIDGTVTVGVDDLGHDVKFFGATATNGYMLWDESTDDLILGSSSNLGIGTIAPSDKLHVADAVTTISGTQIWAEGRYGGYGAGISFVSATSDGGTLVEMAKITGDGESAWDTTAANQDAGLRFFTTLNGTSAEKMRIDADGYMSIGKTGNSGKPLEVYKAADAAIRIQNSTTGVTAGDGLLVEQGGSTSYFWNYEDNVIIFGTNNAEKVRVQSAGGISFNGDTATANALDTYEEGTWSPTYISSNADMTSVVVNSTFTKGTYVRIGKQVWINGFIRTDSIGALGSGYAVISGLPFDSENVAGYNAYPSAVHTFFAFDSDGPEYAFIPNNSGQVWLSNHGSGGAVSSLIDATDLSTAINRNGIAFQITYITDAAV